MAIQNVRFYFGTQAKYDALQEKNSLALYFIEDTQRLYKGSILIASGATATSMASGLMSLEDKIKLDELVAGGALSGLSPVDGTIVISDKVGGGKSIGVAISTQEGNAISVVSDGLFVAKPEKVSVPEYTIEKQAVAEDGFATSYKLKKTVDGQSTYVGDAINIAKDMVLQSATLETVTEADVPYAGAVVGDPYIDMAFNDAAKSHIYIPVNGLVDTYTAGTGIEIVDDKISVKIATNSHGLVAVDGSMSMLLATAEQDGAMSKEDKKALDAIPSVYVARKYEVTSKPVGTLVDYRDKEIRVMVPADTKFELQNSGAGSDANAYYLGFQAYAPMGAVSFKEDLAETIADETMYYFEGNEFAGVDAQGRHYSIVWLPVAKHADGSWTYYGVNSNEGHYIGWFYSVEWFDASGNKIGSDTIRVNLSNEDCHGYVEPYYMSAYATDEQVAALEETISSMEDSFTWGEM